MSGDSRDPGSKIETNLIERGANVATVLMGLCIVVLTVVIGARHISSDRYAGKTSVASDTVPNWNELVKGGHLLGSPAAPVKVVEFLDLQCPGCAIATSDVRKFIDRYPGKVAVIYRHFPLHYHKHADSAALAAECAAKQDRFAEFVDKVLESQDEIGVKVWSAFAADAGVADVPKFEECLRQLQPTQIHMDDQLARDAGVMGTPTFLVNGRRLAGPGATGLEQIVRTTLEGLK
jgi:protein-disulfide isomerase